MAKHKIYVASSWRNEFYPQVVESLRSVGYDVYDFRNPPSGDEGFKWSNVDPNYMDWTPEEYREQLSCPQAERQFKNDIEAMMSCDTCVLVLPCGRSAHTEAGWFAGRGKRVIAYIPTKQEPTNEAGVEQAGLNSASQGGGSQIWQPELMYKLFDDVTCSMEEVIKILS